MTGGQGICHSEVSMPGTRVLRGVQLWVALPDSDRHAPRAFAHHVPEPVALAGGVLRVFLGSLAGSTSPVPTFTPLLGAELVLDEGATVTFTVQPGFEHGVLVDAGDVTVAGCPVRAGELAYVPTGAEQLVLANPGTGPARMVLLGGPPFEEDIVMWWNFVGRSHEEIVAFREAWQAGSDQFGDVVGYSGPVQRLPAPVLPGVRIKPRGNP
jgi:redox-sensitive bicupin YhaK (pirin superfamily)